MNPDFDPDEVGAELERFITDQSYYRMANAVMMLLLRTGEKPGCEPWYLIQALRALQQAGEEEGVDDWMDGKSLDVIARTLIDAGAVAKHYAENVRGPQLGSLRADAADRGVPLDDVPPAALASGMVFLMQAWDLETAEKLVGEVEGYQALREICLLIDVVHREVARIRQESGG